MRAPSQGDFVEGLVVGALGTFVFGVTLIYALDFGRFVSFEDAPELRPVLGWLQGNLGLSLPVFAALLLLFVHGPTLLGRRLDAGAGRALGRGGAARGAPARATEGSVTEKRVGRGLPWFYSIGLHVVLLVLLSLSFARTELPAPPPAVVAVEATVVEEARVDAVRVEPVIPVPRQPAHTQPPPLSAPPLPARVLEPPDATPAVVAAVLDDVIAPAPATLPETPPDAPEAAPPEPASDDVGFSLRFESDAALQQLVTQRRVEVYALVGARSFGLWARSQALGFVEHASPPRLHVMAPETVPASMRAAFERDAGTPAAAVETWGVTLPAPTRTQIDALMHERAGGTIVIDEHGDVRLAARAPTETPS